MSSGVCPSGYPFDPQPDVPLGPRMMVTIGRRNAG